MDMKWLPVYRRFVTSDGRVFRISQDGSLRPCRQSLSRYGYPVIGYGYRKVREVHRLVAEAFVQNPDGKLEVDHINRDRSDNRVENLRWATRSEQMRNTCRYHGPSEPKPRKPLKYGIRRSEDPVAYNAAYNAAHREQRREYARNYKRVRKSLNLVTNS